MNRAFEMPPQAEEKDKKEIQQQKIREALKNIDFVLLREVYAEQARRSGIDASKIGFVDRENIVEKIQPLYALPTAGASYSVKEGKIILDTKGLKLLAGSNKKELENQVLEFICHEEAHAVSLNTYQEEEEDVFFGLVKKSIKIQSGFDQREVGQVKDLMNVNVHFRWFNEGVTDELGAQAYKEYLKRSALGSQKEYDSKYPLARIFVRTFCERLGEECGIPKEVVWQGVVREYLNGTDLLHGEVAELLNEVFSDKFVARLARADTKFLELGPIVMAFHEILDTASAKKVFLEIASKIKKLTQ